MEPHDWPLAVIKHGPVYEDGRLAPKTTMFGDRSSESQAVEQHGTSDIRKQGPDRQSVSDHHKVHNELQYGPTYVAGHAQDLSLGLE